MNRGDRGDQLFVGESLEKGDESGFVVRTQTKTRFRMLGQVRIESSGPVQLAVVMLHHFFEGGEPSVMHVRRRQRHVPQGRHFEFGPVRFHPRHLHPPQILVALLQSIVHELVVAEQVPAVAVKTIPTPQTARGIVLGNEQLESLLFLRSQLGQLARRPVKLGVLREQRQKELFQREGYTVCRDAGRAEGGFESPSQKNSLAQARFTKDIAFRRPACPPVPRLWLWPSVNAFAGS